MLPPILPPDVPSLSKKPLQALISVGGIYLMYLMCASPRSCPRSAARASSSDPNPTLLPSPHLHVADGKFQAQLYRAQEDGTKFGTSGGTFFVLFVQCFTNALIAALVVGVELLYLGHKRELPKKEKDLDKNEKEVKLVPFVEVLFSFELALASFVYVFAMYTSNEALNYVPYSFQAIVKSCKMVPVMIGSIVVSNAKYGLNKWVSVLLIAGGILAFSYVGGEKDDKKKKHGGAQTTSIFGVLLLCASLTLDAVSGPLMKKVDKFGLLSTQNMLASNVWASAYMLVLAGALGQVGGAIGYLLEHNNVAWVLLNFSMTSALGQLFIFYCLREFTPLVRRGRQSSLSRASLLEDADDDASLSSHPPPVRPRSPSLRFSRRSRRRASS